MFNSDKMEPCLWNLNMPSKFTKLEHLFFPIGHVPKRPNSDSTIRIFGAKPKQHDVNNGSKILGLQEVVEMMKTWVYTVWVKCTFQFRPSQMCQYSITFLVWVYDPEHAMGHFESSNVTHPFLFSCQKVSEKQYGVHGCIWSRDGHFHFFFFWDLYNIQYIYI